MYPDSAAGAAVAGVPDGPEQRSTTGRHRQKGLPGAAQAGRRVLQNSHNRQTRIQEQIW